MILGPKEVCPVGTEITTGERCQEADDWALALSHRGVSTSRPVQYGTWDGVPLLCSSQVGHDKATHFNFNDGTDDHRFESGEFVMICEKGIKQNS